MEKAYLILDNGTVFEGERIGAPFAAYGEIAYSTACVGYTQAITDKANAGKLLLWTFPMAGNYGVSEDEAEQDTVVFGFIARECCDTPSNFRCKYTLNEYLLEKGIPGIVGIDTRALMAILREQGSMRAAIASSADVKLVSEGIHKPKEKDNGGLTESWWINA